MQGLGARFGIYFGVDGPMRNYRDAVQHQRRADAALHRAAIGHGVYFHDYGGAACHHGFCAAMTVADVDETSCSGSTMRWPTVSTAAERRL